MDRRIERYGDERDQHGELFVPGAQSRATVAVIHGGFWRDRYARDLMDELCADLAARGYTAWNVEYRRLGSGGGWPETFDDVVAAVRHASARVTIGHSAGGHLALWAGARAGVALAVSQAGVLDLDDAWRRELSGNAASELLGGRRELTREASPASMLPLGISQFVVHGRADDIVPVEMSRGYVDKARAAGDAVELVETDEGHFECLDPCSESWAAITERLP